VRLRRLVVRSRHPMRIEYGSCHDTGELVLPLHDIVANEFGGGRGTTHIAGVTTTNFDSVWHVTVYKGPTMDGGGSQPIACGQVRPIR
jgi:hypothetical protein